MKANLKKARQETIKEIEKKSKFELQVSICFAINQICELEKQSILTSEQASELIKDLQ